MAVLCRSPNKRAAIDANRVNNWWWENKARANSEKGQYFFKVDLSLLPVPRNTFSASSQSQEILSFNQNIWTSIHSMSSLSSFLSLLCSAIWHIIIKWQDLKAQQTFTFFNNWKVPTNIHYFRPLYCLSQTRPGLDHMHKTLILH